MRTPGCILTCIALCSCGAVEGAHVASRAEVYAELFEHVQLESVFPDSKTFVDALPVRRSRA